MSDPDKNGQWLPIQIAPDECDLELGRPQKTGIVPWTFPCRRKSGLWFQVRHMVQCLDRRAGADFALALASLALLPLDADTPYKENANQAAPRMLPRGLRGRPMAAFR
ncbi:hypothetical protein [Bradyrhizobium sp. 186]|uniref:hypothetical protein n=1 Tax=Bradyrhizobium sp. 186 TaxID=2782654 RepID=UPI002001323D|nr:hypothetical protein [Bradyrhizobium sp. 186]